MSCDWNIYCRDCGDTHTFQDANHQLELMRTIIRHAHAISGLHDLLNEALTVNLTTGFGHIDTDFFKRHTGHLLVPISEYGDIDRTYLTTVVVRSAADLLVNIPEDHILVAISCVDDRAGHTVVHREGPDITGVIDGYPVRAVLPPFTVWRTEDPHQRFIADLQACSKEPIRATLLVDAKNPNLKALYAVIPKEHHTYR